MNDLSSLLAKSALAIALLVPVGALAVTIATTTQVVGTLTVTGALSKGSGSFVIDHPLDPKNKLLYHSFVESPDMKNIYDGVATLDENGEAVIELPEYFEALNKDYRYQFFPLGTPMPGLYIRNGVKDSQFIIAGGVSEREVSWQVTGTRKDPYALTNPIIPEVEKGSDTLVKRGEYLFPELYE